MIVCPVQELALSGQDHGAIVIRAGWIRRRQRCVNCKVSGTGNVPVDHEGLVPPPATNRAAGGKVDGALQRLKTIFAQ